MQSEKFEALLAGSPCTLTQGQLLELQAYCSARSMSLQQWITASVGLFASNPEQSYQILCYLDRNQLSKPAYNDYVHQGPKIAIYNALTGLVLAKSTREPVREEAEKMLNEAKRFLNSSQKVRMNVDKSIILNRALLHYYSGQITKALNFLTRTHQQILKTGEGRHLLVTTTLVLAQIHFIKRNYAKSLQLYKKALEINKNLPTKARLGMAYSFYYLGKYEMARACFQRIVKLDPNSVEGHLGIAIIEEKMQNYEEYFKQLKIALNINRDHPLILLHLAEHFLLKSDLQKAFSICLSGLSALERFPKFIRLEDSCRNDYEELKARFNNIIGQIHHINGNFGDAIKYYTLASKKGLVHNEIALAQAYINPSAQNYLEAIKLLDEAYQQFQGKDSRLISDSYKLMGYLKSKIPPKGKEQKNAQYYYSEALKFNRKDFDTKIEYANILAQVNKAKALRQLQQAQIIQRSHLNTVKPQLENNIAVLQLQNGQPQLCEQRLKKCLTILDNMSIQNEEEELRRNSLRIIVRFNYGISLEKQMRWHSAKEVYLEILSMNKYHQDSHIRLAYSEFQLGNHQRVKQIFQEAEKLCSENKFKLLRPERIYVAKAYLQHLGGSSHAAKQTLKQLGKVKDLYAQLFQLCINYENIMRKGVQLSNLKQFLRPNRQFCYKYCSEDPHTMFGYMLLAIVLIADKKFTKSQGTQFFSSLKQFCSEDMPIILYNMGLFLSNYDDHESSNAVLGLYKERVGISNRADQLISANHLFENDFLHSESFVKRNILRDPSNIKYRMQLSYVAERRCLKYYERGVYDRKSVRLYNEQLNRCNNFQTFFSKMVVGDYLRGIEAPQLKQRLKTIYVKIKNAGEERKFYIKSYMDSYQKLAKDLELKEIERKEIERRNQERLQNELKQRQLEKLLQEDSEDEQEREKRIREQKRKRALQLARKRQIQMEINWNELKEKHKELQDEKKSRKRNPSTKPSGPRPRKERPKQDSQTPAISLPSQSEPEANSQPISEEQSLKEHKKKKKNKHKHKNKKKNRDRDRAMSGEDQEGSPQQRSEAEDSEKKENNKDNDDDEDLLLRNYMA